MRKVPKKNYILLTLLLVGTIIITLVCAKIYLNQEKDTSDFYNFCNKITENEFDQYIIEKNEVILYISDKYDEQHKEFEKEFKEKIIELSLNDKLIFMDKENISNNFIKKLKKQYAVDLDLDKLPTIVIITSDSIVQINEVTNNMNVDSIINYEVFE